MEDGAVFHAAEPGFDAVTGFGENSLFAGFYGLHVDVDLAVDLDAEVGGAADHVGCVGTGDEGLGGDTAVLTQVPPKRLRSTKAIRRPLLVRRPARDGPAWPLR